jgi:predicted DNA-binding transcriptional regulator YafY
VLIEAEQVELHTPHFRRPMRLVAPELRAVELGLAMLAAERPPEEQGAIAGARKRLRAALVAMPHADGGDEALAASSAAALDEAGRAHLAVLRDARLARHRVTLRYRRPDAEVATSRTACPYALVAARGSWYLVAWCDHSAALRVFRLDRIEAVAPTAARFELPADFRVEQVVQGGRAFVAASPPPALVVRYSPQVARWIAERETGTTEADGSLVVTYPLADPQWAVRHVLQYGPDAEVVAPPEVRALVAERLDALLADDGGTGA